MSIFKKIIHYDDTYIKEGIRNLKNKVWKLEHPAKFKTNEKALYENRCGAKLTTVTVVREDFNFDSNGLISSRLYLIIVEDCTTLVSEWSLIKNKK